MRFNKFTHLSLLVVFAIIFIVIYLYYTISDVKKIHQEVSKLTRDMEFLNGSLQQMTAALLTNTMPMATPGSVLDIQTVSHVQPAKLETESVENPSTPAVAPEQVQESNDDDDDEVASQELQQIMESIKDDEEQEEQNASSPNVDINSIDVVDATESITNKHSVAIEKLTMEELKKVSYDDIKKYCKEHSINTKGTKDVLIYRIAQSKAA